MDQNMFDNRDAGSVNSDDKASVGEGNAQALDFD